MSNTRKTVIVTGASQGIGAGIVRAFVARGDNVVATSRKVTQSTEVAASDRVALVDGEIGEPTTAAKIVETALSRFRSIEALVNNAGIFFTKPFTDYTVEDFRSLVSTNLGGDGESVADGSDLDGQGNRGRGPVPDRRRDGDGSHLVRRWRRSFRPLVNRIERSP
jgi:NAD(P)-dependent dehydrogenase (short-subunit alcohol dehydrogenase family)